MPIKNVNSFDTAGTISLNSSNSLLGIINGELKRVNTTGLSITPSGLNLTSGTYRINNAPYNTFTMFFFHDSQTMVAGHNYFGNYQTSPSPTRANRGVVVPEAAVARKATWNQLLIAAGNPSLNATGYFINATTNATGIISTGINVQNVNTPGNYYADLNPPIPVSAGDLVLCSFFSPTYATTFPTAVKNSVNIYFYN